MTRKKIRALIAGLILTAGVTLGAVACTGGTSGVTAGQQQENAQQQQDTTSLEASQPIPHYNWSQIRQTAIDAEDIAANGAQTTSFFFQMGDQDPIFSCPSIGMPVPDTAQLSNPDQVEWNSAGSDGISSAVTGQMDPDGIYAPSSSSGTYVICVNSSGAKYLQYWEGDVMTVAAAAQWDTATHALKVTGAPTAAVHTAPAGSAAARQPSPTP